MSNWRRAMTSTCIICRVPGGELTCYRIWPKGRSAFLIWVHANCFNALRNAEPIKVDVAIRR